LVGSSIPVNVVMLGLLNFSGRRTTNIWSVNGEAVPCRQVVYQRSFAFLLLVDFLLKSVVLLVKGGHHLT
jgi:hypothetical protein